MKIIDVYNHHVADTALSDEIISQVTSMLDAVDATNCLRVAKEEKKKGQKTYAPRKINKKLKAAASEQGWALEKRFNLGEKTRTAMDFYKDSIGVESQFGKYAFALQDALRFLIAFKRGLIKMGVIILPSNEMAKGMSSGVPNFRQTTDWLKELIESLKVPLIVIGVTV